MPHTLEEITISETGEASVLRQGQKVILDSLTPLSHPKLIIWENHIEGDDKGNNKKNAKFLQSLANYSPKCAQGYCLGESFSADLFSSQVSVQFYKLP